MCFWITIIFLLILIIATIPAYPYSRTWGYYPAGGAVALLILLLLLWWLAVLPAWYYPYGAPAEPVAPTTVEPAPAPAV